jgi:hypothetical protein
MIKEFKTTIQNLECLLQGKIYDTEDEIYEITGYEDFSITGTN